MVSSFLILNTLTLSASAMAILSRFQIKQLRVFLSTEQFILNSICYLMSENSILFDILNICRAVACSFFFQNAVQSYTKNALRNRSPIIRTVSFKENSKKN